ncbi:MAG: hypothetical protein WBD31_25715 [Rubripirellula sp.]
MEILLFLLVIWAFVTVVGHGSWVMIRGLIRLFAVQEPQDSQPGDATSEQRDLAAAHRVVSRLMGKGFIDTAQGVALRETLRDLEWNRIPKSKAEPVAEPDDEVATELADTTAVTDSTDSSVTQTTPEPIRQEPDAGEEIVEATLVSDAEPTNEVVPAASLQHRLAARAADSPVADDATPALSTSEVIGSFLAARNIRWGELVAGMLIVICSIGLVISLWNTLIETHPAIPSLIFLAANAAIYASGFYTLGRWKLRHTSRAVLVIASLLVPLSVLAGLAAAGTGASSVHLNDPVTLMAIAFAGSIYLWLVYRGGKALVRRHLAAAMTLAVAGPTVILPLMPAGVRTFGASAGWIVAVASIAVAIAVSMVARMGLRKPTMGASHVRSHFMVIGLGLFSLAIAIGHTVFVTGSTQSIAIAIATIPALVAIAGAARLLMSSARSAVGSVTAAIICVICLGGSVAILPPAMTSAGWLWCWALAWTISGLVIGRWLRQPMVVALATVPVGLAAMLTSPTWISGLPWNELNLLRRVIGGEPMLVAAAMGVASAAVAWALRAQPISRSISRWMKVSAGGWIGLAAISAMCLSVSPVASMGVVPVWAVTVVLAIGTLAGAWISQSQSRGQRQAGLALGGAATVLGGMSILHPWSIGQHVTINSMSIWMQVGIGSAVIWMAICEYLKTKPVSRHWNYLGVAAWIIVAIVACVTATHHASASAISLAACAAGLLWSASASRSNIVLRLSQIATLAFVTVLGYAYASQTLFSSDAWQSGLAPWGWSIVLAAVVAAWLVVRRLARLENPLLQNRIGFLGSPSSRFEVMPDGQAWLASIGLAFIGAVWPLATMLLAIFHEVSFSESPIALPIVTFIGLVGIVVWQTWQRLDREPTAWEQGAAATIAASALAWSIGRGVSALPVTAPEQLVLATSLIAITAWLAACWRSTFKTVGIAAPVAIAISSAALLAKYWWTPILAGQLAPWFPAVAVGIWWGISAIMLLNRSRQQQSIEWSAVSATLFAAATVVLSATLTRSPVTWMQIASIGLIAWSVLTRTLAIRFPAPSTTQTFAPAVKGSLNLASVIGVGSAVAVTAAILTRLPLLVSWASPSGFILSLLVLVIFTVPQIRKFLGFDDARAELACPFGITLIAGQVAYAAYAMGWLSGPPLIVVIAGVWLLGSAASVGRSAWNSFYRPGDPSSSIRTIDLVHTAVVAVLTFGLAWSSGRLTLVGVTPWLVITSLALAGFQVALVQASPNHTTASRRFSQSVGWFTVIASFFAWQNLIPSTSGEWVLVTVAVVWATGWWIVWRISSSRQTESQSASPDGGLVSLLTIAVIGEIANVVLGSTAFPVSGLAEVSLWIRLAAYAAIPIVGIALSKRQLSQGNLVAVGVASLTLLSVHTANQFDTDMQIRWMVAALSSGFAVALVSHLLPLLARKAPTSTSPDTNPLMKTTVNTSQVASLVAIAGIAASVFMIAFDIADQRHVWVTQLTVLSVAMAAWAMAVLAEISLQSRMRHIAVGMAMTTAALMASIGTSTVDHPLLETSMRWFVAAVVAIPMWLFAFPKLAGPQISQRWSSAFRSGAISGAVAAIGSLVVMLVIEAIVRQSGEIDGVSRTMVGGVAVSLALLSGLSGLVAVLSGPGTKWQSIWNLSDRARRSLVIASQCIGAICWLHLHLCKSPWALVGLRAYWPLIVMSLAFASVGITEWARRRGDRVIETTLKQTALYLPLIPLIGFWFSGGFTSDWNWAFIGDKVRYDVVLGLGAVYYLAISAIWKSVLPRISAVVLANAALWVMLVQQPGWGFLAHPQAWLIPPAVCVLAVTHFYRQRLNHATTSAIRYAATLLIYISSTADMLIAEIGTSISGPIVLIVLALVGMLAGVVLRVAPFLYLGAIFVFLGAASMVRHAQQSIDAVWPWWVFGITTGILLLVGLTMLEKNKGRLKSYAQSLNQ